MQGFDLGWISTWRSPMSPSVIERPGGFKCMHGLGLVGYANDLRDGGRTVARTSEQFGWSARTSRSLQAYCIDRNRLCLSFGI